MNLPSRLLALLVAVLPGVAAAAAVAIVDVTVLPMDSNRSLPHQTVLVEGDRIVQVGPVAEVKVPADARRISGKGRFLMPGLAEMHGHNPALGSTPEFVAQVYFLYVANGVTTVRSMLGYAGQIELRDQVRKGGMVGPTLYLAGPSFSGNGAAAVLTPQAAIDRVRAQQAEGWDLLKVHPGLKVEVYDAMAKTAKEVGIEFSGHVPAAVGLVHAIKAGQRTIDHLDGYIEHLKAQDAPVDAAKLKEIVAFTKETGTWVVPTMALWEAIIGSADADHVTNLPELKYLPKRMVDNWRTSYVKKVTAPNFNATQARQIAANRKVLLKALADADTRIMFGTDAPQIFSVPGFSIHRELKAMAEVGMSNYAILRSATKAVGDYYAGVDKFGTVAVGQRADLLLLEGDPLQSLDNVAKRAGVMVRGSWIAEEEIQRRLAQIAADSAK